MAETRGAMQAEVAQLKQQLAEAIAAAEHEKAELLAQMAGDTQAAEKAGKRHPKLTAAPAPLSAALEAAEYSNSVVASRDTNVSPREVYDTIRDMCRPPDGATRALDLGAGAGASTQTLLDLGWRDVVAVDPSRAAWDRFVGKSAPGGVRFEQTSDDGFFEIWSRDAQRARFDLVVINYAINPGKAQFFARNLLSPRGKLLAPVNCQPDYWFEQRYELLDASARVEWERAAVGSWAVLFQPDFTASSCSGQWCPALRADADAANLRL